VPLSKPLDVFRVFGVEEFTVYPQEPQARNLKLVQITSYERSVREKLKKIGIDSIRINYPFDKVSASDGMGMGFLRDHACVSIDDVRKVFGPISKSVSNPKVGGGITIHPTSLPPPMHEYYVMVIELQDMQPAYKVSLNFNFEYQTCATGAGVKNILNISKGQQQ
jgi:hypothetical protein